MDPTSVVESYVWTLRKVQLILCFASIVLHNVAAITIWKNNVLKKPVYMYILSVIINNTIEMLLVVILHLAQEVIGGHTLYVIAQIIIFLQAGNILTSMAVTLRYPVRPDVYSRCIISIWTITILIAILFTIFYLAFYFYMFNILSVMKFLEFLVLLVLLVACRVIHRKERGDYALQLNFVSLYVCCHLFHQLWSFIAVATASNQQLILIIAYVRIQSASYGVVNAIALMFFDRKYKICLLETVKCSRTKYFDTHESEDRNATLLSSTTS